jgi:hypothetical protein
MNEDKAREILEDGEFIITDSSLSGSWEYVSWKAGYGDDNVTLDGEFTADQLEAIAFWMRRSQL